MSATIGIAVDIPEPFGRALRAARRDAGDELAESVPPHITLLPPTEIEAADLPRVKRHLAIAASHHEPFEVHLRGTGTFRPVTEVVFVVVARGISECEQLESDVRSGPLLLHRRFPYHPHVTVAQDVSPDRLDNAYDGLAGFEARFVVHEFTLYEHHSDGQWVAGKEYPLEAARRA